MVIPFRIHIQSSSSGTSARSNVSLTNEKHAQKIDIKTEKRAQSKQEHVLAVLHNCTNDYMWLSYTVLWGEKWCQLTHTTTEQWWVIPYKVMMLWTKRERKNAHTRLVTNDESSQLNTSHDEGNKVLEKGKRQPQCHHKRWQLWCHRFSETKVKALLNHTQSTSKSRG